MGHNAFQHGFAKQTEDPAIIAATTANPGVVLKRAVGTSGDFKENAELPKSLPRVKAPETQERSPKTKAPAKAKQTPKAKTDPKAERAAILSFKKAQEKRDRERAEQERRLEIERVERRQAVDKAQGALEEGQEVHEATMAAIEREREKLDQRAESERRSWEAKRKKLAEAVDRSRR